MTKWDLRAAVRALMATLVALVVVWVVTAVTDEGQLTATARAARTVPLAPLCSAVGAVLALRTSRVRSEVLALEALGRSPVENARAAAIGAAVPSILMAIAIAASTSVDVGGFYPRVAHETFVREQSGFVSTSLGVSVADDGEARALEDRGSADADEGLPRRARAVAAATTGIAGLALSLVAARGALRASLSDKRSRRRSRLRAATAVLACALATLVAFQAAAARIAPAAVAVLPPLALLVLEIVARRSRYRAQHESAA